MRAHGLATWLRLLVAALVLSLGSGMGLPGLVRTLVPADGHVCTCASGGVHRSCPVCNPSQHERRSPQLSIDGVPCGERTTAVAALGDPAIVQQAFASAAAAFAYKKAFRHVQPRPDSVFLERATPPPRSPST